MRDIKTFSATVFLYLTVKWYLWQNPSLLSRSQLVILRYSFLVSSEGDVGVVVSNVEFFNWFPAIISKWVPATKIVTIFIILQQGSPIGHQCCGSWYLHLPACLGTNCFSCPHLLWLTVYPDIQWRRQWDCFWKCWNCSSVLRYNFQVGPSHQNNQTARWSWIGYQWCRSLIHNNYTWHLGSGVTGHDHETQRTSQLQLLHIWVIVEWYLSQCHLGYPSPARPKVVNWWQWGAVSLYPGKVKGKVGYCPLMTFS